MLRHLDLRPHLRFGTAAVVVGAFAACVASGIGGEPVVRSVDDLVTAAAALAASVLCIRAARSADPPMRLFWSMLAGATAAWFVGELAWAFDDLVLGDGPVLSWADAGYLAAMPLAAAALLVHPEWRRSAADKTRSVLDGLAIAAALFFVLWIVELGPLWLSTDLTTLSGIVALTYLVGDVVVVFLVVLVIRGQTRGVGVDLWCLLFGLTAIMLSDAGYAYLVEVEGYATGNLIDIGWLAGYVAIAVGALSARRRPLERLRPVAPTRSHAAALAPCAPLLGALTLLAVEINLGRQLDRVAWLTACALVVLVLVRQSVLAVDLLRHGAPVVR